MAYIGNTPAESFASFEKQVFTIVNSQTAYTLSHSVVNENKGEKINGSRFWKSFKN